MGVFVQKAKRKNFRAFIEIWKPKRKIITIKPENYPTYNLNDRMTYEQADSAAKEYNLKTKIKKDKDAKVVQQAQLNSLLNEFSLPEYLVDDFERELKVEYKFNPDRLVTLMQHWRSTQLMLFKLKIDFTQFYDSRFKIFEYYEKKLWSPDYIKRITKLANKWGSFCARKKGAFFEPIPKIGIRIQPILEKRKDVSEIRRPAMALTWEDLRSALSHFESDGLLAHWNWLFISLFFGLRPSETDSLKNSKNYRIEKDKKNKINVLKVYQNKLKNLSESKRWKVIPVVEKEQIKALQLILNGNFTRPLPKTIKRILQNDEYDLYSPRKGFTDLMLNRGYELEDVSIFLGHTSIETTWRHYKNKLAYKLPSKKRAS